MDENFFIIIVLFFSLFSNVISKSGKAQFFLQSRAFEGDPSELNNLYNDPISVNSGSARKVLFGHYSAILENKPDSDGSLSMFNTPTKGKKSQLSKIVEIYRKNLFLVIKSAIDITTGEKSSDFLNLLESCREALEKCDNLGDLEIRCGIECLTQGHDFLHGLTDALASLVDRFCLPINTIFDYFFEIQGKVKHPSLSKFWAFIRRFNETKQVLPDVAVQGASSLVSLIIDRIRTDMLPYRLFNQKLKTELQAEELLQPGFESQSTISNSLCLNVDDADVAVDLTDILYRNPALVDAIFGGLTTLNLVSKYIPGRFQVPFAASAEAVRMLTGSVCGLIQYGETGTVPSCDQIGGFPVPGIPLPAIPDMPNLTPECLQGNTVDGGNSEAPSVARSKRAVGAEIDRDATITKMKDGGYSYDDESSKELAGNGGLEKKKRSLIVGKRKLKSR